MNSLRNTGKGIAFLLVLACCAHIPEGRRGVESLEIEGMEEMAPRSLRACLGTQERESLSVDLGALTGASCGEPPFDDDALEVSFWTWPWTEWPLFDPTLFRQDLRRVERWYAARGFYEAEVVEHRIRSTFEGEECAGDDCTVEVQVEVREGPPTLVRTQSLRGVGELPSEIADEVRAAIDVELPRRFDETLLEDRESVIREVLGRYGRARASVVAIARVDRGARQAELDISVEAGPVCQFGETRVEGVEDAGIAERIAAAAAIPAGDRYDQSLIPEAQHAVFALGAFSSVTVEPILGRDEGTSEDRGEERSGAREDSAEERSDARESEDGAEGERGGTRRNREGNGERRDGGAEPCVVPVRVEVEPGRRHRYGVGVGVQAGVDTVGAAGETIDVPQWDLHLKAHWEDRNFFGGLRRLRLEDQPRLIVQERFPGFEQPRFGNRARVTFRQPGFLEPRTDLVMSATWDYGPDPFDTFFRHQVDARTELEREFFDQRLKLTAGPRAGVFRVPEGELRQNDTEPPADSHVLALHQGIRVDLRDDGRRPYRGALLLFDLSEAGYIPKISSWDYVRAIGDARVYLPLPARLTLALRMSVGALYITDASSSLDEESKDLGPRSARLRGGGASSHRGFLPGRLGDGPNGGTRRWLASAELRIPISESLGVAAFTDAGDVSQGSLRWNHPQLAVGAGLRYFTVIGALRLDIAGRIPRAQVFGIDQRTHGAKATAVDFFGLFDFPGAVHITLGEAF